jgi:hypothetical protein
MDLIRDVYDSLEVLKTTSKERYQMIKSFLKYPYQTVCNDFSSLDTN